MRKGIGTHWRLNLFFMSAALQGIELVLNGWVKRYNLYSMNYTQLRGNSVKINIHMSLFFLYKLGLGLGKVENQHVYSTH